MNNGWPSKQMSEVCSKITDGSHNPPKGIAFGEYLMLSSKNILDDEITIDNPRFLSKSDFEMENRRTNVTPGDVLLTIVGTVGRVAVVDKRLPKFTLQRSVAVLKTERDKIEPRFLMRYLQSALEHLTNTARGVAQKGIYLNQLKMLDIPVPPIAEQKRIVAILDEAFEAIGKAKQNAEKNLQNARELFESHLQSVFTQRGDGWVEKELNEIARLIDSLHKTPSYIGTGGFPMVRVTDVSDGVLNLAKCKRVDKQVFDEFSRRHTPRIGDIVLSRVGSYGVPALVQTSERFCLGQNTVFILTDINSRFLYHFLRSPNSREQIDKMVSGTTQPTISLKSIKQIVIPVPPETEQNRVVDKIDVVYAETQRLESVYRRKIAALNELKKSLLHRAFSGEL